MHIAILSAAPSSKATKSIKAAAEKRKHTVEVLNPADLYLLISDSESGYDRIYDGNNVDTPKRIVSKKIDCIIPRIGGNLEYGTLVLEHLNKNLDTFSTQSPFGLRIASDKMLSLQRLSQAGIKVPKTIVGDRAFHGKFMIDKIGQLPAIAKTLKGSQGTGVYPLFDPQQTNVFLANFQKTGQKLQIQSFVDGDCKDIRVIVIDGSVIVAMERTAAKGEVRSNLSLGGSGKKITLSKEDQEMCVKAARACGLEVAGVDLMKNSEGQSFVIEVNGNYGYYVEGLTGIDISTPLIEYCERNYKKGGTVQSIMLRQIMTSLTLLEANLVLLPDTSKNEIVAMQKQCLEIKRAMQIDSIQKH